jgi:hypothetical protein
VDGLSTRDEDGLHRRVVATHHIVRVKVSGVWEEASDWDGTPTGSFEKSLTVKEIHQKFGFPVGLKTT